VTDRDYWDEELTQQEVLDCTELLIEITTMKIGVSGGVIDYGDDALADSAEAIFADLDKFPPSAIGAAACLLLEAAFTSPSYAVTDDGDMFVLPMADAWAKFIHSLKQKNGKLGIDETR